MTVTETFVAGRYRVIRPLGAGGMGRVWLARDEVLCRDVAIKEILLPFGLPDAQREELRLRTLREARAAARLSHPNVVQIYDVQSGDDQAGDQQPWIVMEYVRSRSLLQVVEENGPLPVEQVAGIGLAILSALDAANRVGVLHRDVKPSNVLIADDGRVVLTDFGSALIDEGEGALTRTGVILGSPQFIAPERVDKGVSTPEADLWSLGATLYAAVEGRPPYTRSTTLRSLIAITTDRPDPTHLAGPLKPVLSGLLQRNPQSRMKPVEVEQRLRRLADVQTTVHLRHIPEQRSAELTRSARYELAAAAAPAPETRSPAAEAIPAEARQARGAQPAPSVPGGTARRWRVAAASGVAAVIIPLAAVAGSSGTVGNATLSSAAGPDSGYPRRALPVATAPAVAPSPSASPTPFVLPRRYSWWVDQTGWRIAYPTSYSHLREGPNAMFFCAPGGPPTIRVRVWDTAGADLTKAIGRLERTSRLPGYHRIRLDAVPGAQDNATAWEYTYTDPKAGKLHGLERVFTAGGHTYLIQWRTPVNGWTSHQPTHTIVMDSFRPA
jgi:serine/threonine protein kinase